MPRQLSMHPGAVRAREQRARVRNRQTAEGSLRATSTAVRDNHLQAAERTRTAQRAEALELRRQSGKPLEYIASYRPPPISNPWRTTPCEFCGALLLSAEDPKWCCKLGAELLPPLPPMTPGLGTMLAVPQQALHLREHSRSLNNLFCLSALGVSEKWTEYTGMIKSFVRVA
ncbi:hypothetical protein DL93DRAFT_2092056 [Clavulina sp. PMI_390]|nr:hypothetical protein DL93DRAFT_2092056 [Clavulina sp. PMI_390]